MKKVNRLLLMGCLWIGLWLVTAIAFAQERYPLTVQLVPADSQVRILHIDSPYEPGILLPPGVYKLEISRDGYKTTYRKVRLAEEPLTVKVTLLTLDAVLMAALQSGDLQYWRDIFATPPPSARWLSALRSSPIYWLLSPMTWFWLLLIWAMLAYGHRGCRLSTFGRLGLLSLILALPIGWLLSLDPLGRVYRLASWFSYLLGYVAR